MCVQWRIVAEDHGAGEEEVEGGLGSERGARFMLRGRRDLTQSGVWVHTRRRKGCKQ